MSTPAPLYLYVWDEFHPDYTEGLAFAIAPDLEAARALVLSKTSLAPEHIEWGPVTIHYLTEPCCYARIGGA
jgi:hypothetical protein